MRIFASILLSLPFIALGQMKEKKVNQLTLKTDSATYVAHYIKKQTKTNSEANYYWTRLRNIHRTVGAYSGFPLHGDFTAYYLNGQLKEKGEFQTGLKTGRWVRWSVSGEMISTYVYSKGVKHGEFSFMKQDTLVQGRNKSGVFHGKVEYTKDGRIIKTERFKKGESVELKIEKKSKSDKEQPKSDDEQKQRFQLRKLFKVKRNEEQI